MSRPEPVPPRRRSLLGALALLQRSARFRRARTAFSRMRRASRRSRRGYAAGPRAAT